MKPPYLFVVINAIIITIVACSRSNQNQQPADQPQRVRYQRLISVRTPPAAHFEPVAATPHAEEMQAALVVYEGGDRIVELRPVLVNGLEVGADSDEEAAADAEAEAGDMFQDLTTSLTSENNPPEENFPPELQLECYNPTPASEQPQISPSFPHRNLIRTTTPEGLEEVTEEAGQVTLESVWKRITESSRREPTGENLNHSDTAERRRLEKSETFRDRKSHHHPPPPPRKDSPGLMKEITPSRDELNRQAEDFIKKVYEEMRLERLESLNKRVLSSGA